ncbi:MAG: Na+/H+ antiporter subunit E [Candidatus Omnitrophica bacterium]|nr:Na+/H+ antiporter subunit E [Candidatus Omnitrophota bacterium]
MKRLVLALLSFIVWILLIWPFTAYGIDWQGIIIGIFSSIIVGILFGDAFTDSPHRFFEIRRYLWLIYFIFVFVWSFLEASFDFAYRVLHPSLPIKPGIIKVKTKLKKRAGIAMLANSIGFAPGAVTVEVVGDTLYIHMACLKYQDTDEATAYVVRRFERILERIFE